MYKQLDMIWVYLYTPSGPYSIFFCFQLFMVLILYKQILKLLDSGLLSDKTTFSARGTWHGGGWANIPLSRGPRDGPFLDFLGITGSIYFAVSYHGMKPRWT